MTEALPLAAVKDRFSELVDRVESLEETLEIMSDPEAMAAIREAERELAEGGGEVITEAEARARWVNP